MSEEIKDIVSRIKKSRIDRNLNRSYSAIFSKYLASEVDKEISNGLIDYIKKQKTTLKFQ